ncbi:MAG: hypothetical protein IJZ88_02450 [Clostridia bacterium]|nr:hypothetical protein [Clostridia bacterium]
MPENVSDISENIQGGCSILYAELLWWGQLLYKETAAISNGNKPHKNVPTFQKKFLESKKPSHRQHK